MQVIYTRCAGLDVHKKSVVACRLIGEPGTLPRKETRTFGTTTRDLLALSDWLAEAGVTHVVMESTGVYWKPVYNLLEGSFTLLLANAQHVKGLPGRKSDLRDAEWLADLLRHGLLKGSFVPDRAQRELRELTRYRTSLVQERVAEVNRIQKVLEGANVKLGNVLTDVFGLSGQLMLEALLEGKAEPQQIAELAQRSAKKKIPQIGAGIKPVICARFAASPADWG